MSDNAFAMSNTGRRAPFTGKSGDCEDLSGEIEALIPAELPEFCKIENLVRVVTAVPGEPEKPTIPITNPSCPCPKSSSPFITFDTSEDCCDWVLKFDFEMVSDCTCEPLIEYCKCTRLENGSEQKCPDGHGGREWCCLDQTFERGQLGYVCEFMEWGEWRVFTKTYEMTCVIKRDPIVTKKIKCPLIRMIYKPPKSSGGNCTVRAQALHCEDEGGTFTTGVSALCSGGKLCIDCSGKQGAISEGEDTSKMDCVDIGFRISEGAVEMPEPSIHIEQQECLTVLKVDGNVYKIGGDNIVGVKIEPTEQNDGFKLLTRTCADDTWVIVSTFTIDREKCTCEEGTDE